MAVLLSTIVTRVRYHKQDLGEGSELTEHSLEKFLESVERKAFRMAQFATANADDAVDLVQEAMLGFVQHYGKKDEREWSPLFYKILQSRITDWHRRSLVRNRLRAWFGPRKEEEEDLIDNAPDPLVPDLAGIMGRDSMIAAIGEAIVSLPLRQQQAFLLRVWEGLDVSQTAFAMGCSTGSVKTHYFRALQALRDQLKEYQP